MGILDLLFGKKIIKQDDFFGEMKSDRTRKNDETKSISWGFNKKIGQFQKETYIILEGNYNNVNPTQKSQLKSFIENFDSIYSLETDKLIESNNKFMKFKNWRNEYYIAFICPLWGSNTNFEINFEPIDEENNDNHFSYELINGVLKNIATY
ncbi:hypothetical protein FLJC2902T_31570 [Flavobacterium limnosediminis JC2902]|uniref:Uncharacterized protein n=1 Tax=Flavobacterium limnosediminis JC2902 TaxID=1341181 RepID=V6SG45_9FLAO|nr:hypothetical protein [Flavobacterium limnosediminis]ESU25217.1 hypothetical protein FLJC2902T_31570 [Flavobacterium limnosediminis JC2902]